MATEFSVEFKLIAPQFSCPNFFLLLVVVVAILHNQNSNLMISGLLHFFYDTSIIIKHTLTCALFYVYEIPSF